MQKQVEVAGLYQAWQELRREQTHLRARDAATQLGVSEAQLTASRIGVDTQRLVANWAELLAALEPLGYVMALTRNEHCVHERKGIYRELSIAGNGTMGIVVSPDIDLRLFLNGWSSAFAVAESTERGVQRSIQIFDKQGTAVHKVFLTEKSDVAAWDALVARFADPEQSAELSLTELPAPAAVAPDADIDVAALRSEWAELKDTHHFYALLKKHGVARTQAMRLAGEEWAQKLPNEELPALLEAAGERQVPIMVFVGNAHCIQIHSGPVSNLRWMNDWFNVLDPEFNLHLKTSGVRELWRVRKPSTDGVITSWEAFDERGELIVQLFGARKPGIPERADWRELAETAEALEA